MDKLEKIFELQEILNKRVGVKTNGFTEKEQIEWVLNYSRAIQQEASELVDSLPWKWWKKEQFFDKENAKMEVIDLFHFIVSTAQVLGMNADDFFSAYLEKNKINHSRQDNNY